MESHSSARSILVIVFVLKSLMARSSGIAHRATDEDVYDGYYIPAG